MGRHTYRIREIAMQAGLSEATVDRVLNNRGNVRASTEREVYRAIADLDRQQSQLRLTGRTFLVDLVMQTPERFSTAVRSALEAELPTLRPAVIRARFHFRETGPAADVAATLDRLTAKRSQGVILKAPAVPEIAAAAARLPQAGIPVVTLVTDIPDSGRLAYVGMDNRAAGATAAYLLTQWLRDQPGTVLVTLSSTAFRGEEERETGFRDTMRRLQPGRRLVDVTEGAGLDDTQYDLVLAALTDHPKIRAVYSIGGGNIATIAAFDALGRPCSVFIGHDLDHDNTRLLRDRRLSAVLHHDLNEDMRRACQIIMQAHKALPGPIVVWPSSIHVITPYNVPGRPAV
jgi:LacI family transcriptional regulator, galactose operon repressor